MHKKNKIKSYNKRQQKFFYWLCLINKTKRNSILFSFNLIQVITTIKKHFHDINIISVLCERCWICSGDIFVNTPTLTTTFLVLPDDVFERWHFCKYPDINEQAFDGSLLLNTLSQGLFFVGYWLIIKNLIQVLLYNIATWVARCLIIIYNLKCPWKELD